MQATTTDFLSTLRSKTNDNHKALEQVYVSAVLMSDAVTIADYTTYLKRMYGFVKSFESFMAPLVASAFPALQGREKLQWLTADLNNLGVDVDKIPVIETEELVAIYPGNNEALGGFYVMEGSTLGGQIISRHLEKKLGDAVTGKLTYIKAYGEQTGSRWKSFLAIFSEMVETNKSDNYVINGAVKTFGLLEKWLLSHQ